MEKENPQKCNVEHLKIIEAVIARLANNAFVLKNWFITVFGGLLVVYLQKDTNLTATSMFLLGTMVIVSFYFMNVKYLWLERCYRKKYQEVRLGKCEDFDMDIEHIKKSDFRNKYISFTFIIYALAFICLLTGIFFKNYELFVCYCICK